MSTHLLLVSLGPVQSFIAQARKLRDLRSGSRLLSQLTQHVCARFKEAGGEVIVPGDTGAEGLPNRMLGTVAGKTDAEVVDLAKALETAALAYWRTAADVVRDALPKGGAPDWDARFDEQIDQLLECYWAVEPYGGPGDYVRAYRAIEARLGAVKNARAFRQIGAGFGGDEASRKDAMTGERDALVFGFGESRTRSGWPATTDPALPIRLGDRGPLVGPNEGLSAVSAVKRLRDFDHGKQYYSTADVALLGLVTKLERADLPAESAIETLRWVSNGGDGQLAFDENVNADYFDKQGLSLGDLERVRGKQRRWRDLVRDAGLRQTPYYAILAFDGDNVGQWLSGRKLGKVVDGATLSRFHEDVGKYLAAFAKTARAVVDEADDGITVYAGGDDYLGLLTLDAVFDVLQALRAGFRRVVSDAIRAAYPAVAEEFSFSAGLVVAHYKRPLGDTVALAHAAEKAAKEGGRDALCIRVVKRSGEQQQAVLPWGRPVSLAGEGTDATAYPALVHLRNTVAGLQQLSSRTWLTESARTVTALFGKGAIPASHREMLELELLRLFDRATREAPAGTGDARASAKQALRFLVESATGQRAAEGLVHALQIVDFFKRHVNDLSPRPLALTDDTPLEAAA